MKKKRDDSVSLSLKVTRIMKITLILILVGVIQVSATTYAQEHRISVSVKNGTFYDVVSQIERQSEFMFFYKSEEIDGNQRINLNAKNKLVSEILDEITKNNNLTYKVTGKHIIITKTAITSQITKEIVGVVTDERGEPIVGANVVEKGTSNGTITDLEGKFSLTVSEKSVLIVSYIGYNTQDVTVTSKTVYNIQLEEDSQALDEVVVVGYGTQKKVNLTGSVASVSSDEIKDRVQTDVLSSIQGTVPGVTIVSRPGKDVSINFRGRGNLGTSEPLYVIDGAIADATFFSNLDPNSIENISFLKDTISDMQSHRGRRIVYDTDIDIITISDFIAYQLQRSHIHQNQRIIQKLFFIQIGINFLYDFIHLYIQRHIKCHIDLLCQQCICGIRNTGSS